MRKFFAALTVGFALLFTGAGPALAAEGTLPPVRCHSQVYGGGQVCPPMTTAPPVATVPTTTTAPPASPGLPFTGGDVVGLSVIGLGAVAGGTALVRSGRRKAADA